MVVHGYVDQMIGFVETDGFAVLRQAARDGDVFAEGILGGAKGFGFKQCLASGEKALAVGLNLVVVAGRRSRSTEAINQSREHGRVDQRFDLTGEMLPRGDGENRNAGLVRVRQERAGQLRRAPDVGVDAENPLTLGIRSLQSDVKSPRLARPALIQRTCIDETDAMILRAKARDDVPCAVG